MVFSACVYDCIVYRQVYNLSIFLSPQTLRGMEKDDFRKAYKESIQ